MSSTAMPDHEYTVIVPPLSDDDVPVMIGISAAGGGTVGQSYADNRWDYAVYADGEMVISGQNLRSGRMGATHAEMARTLCSFLSADGETLAHPGDDAPELTDTYRMHARTFLASEYERLGLFADDEDDAPAVREITPGDDGYMGVW